MSRGRLIALMATGAMLLALTALGLLLQLQDSLDLFLVVVALQSGLYLAAVWLAWGGSSRRALLVIAAIAAVTRLPVILAPPYLSSDGYRYVWDGRIEAAGFNPYRYAPTDPVLEELRDKEIFRQIASPYAPTVYPPAAQAVFLLVTRIGASVTVMKAAMVACEVVIFFLVVRLLSADGLPPARVVVYAWHPLPLWEFAGSGHIDVVLIAFCLTALWAARRERRGLAGFFLAGATLTKFYPAILLPVLYRRWGWQMPTVFAATIVLAYLPFASAGSRVLGFLPGYAAQEGFDANGVGFYLLGLLRYLPPLASLSATAYAIGAMALLAALGAALVFTGENLRAPNRAVAALATALMILLSPHYPWYFAWLIVFACFVRSFALLWLTNASFLLYLLPGYVFVPNAQRLELESLLYGPFAALALAELWYHRRRASRSSQPCPSA